MMYRKENILTGFETGKYNDSPYFIYTHTHTHLKPAKQNFQDVEKERHPEATVEGSFKILHPIGVRMMVI